MKTFATAILLSTVAGSATVIKPYPNTKCTGEAAATQPTDFADKACMTYLENFSKEDAQKAKVGCLEITEEPVGTITGCTLKWGTVKNGLFNSADGTPATHTYLAMDGKDWKAPPIHKDFKAGAGKICKTKVGESIAAVTDHATCKAGCAKAAALSDDTKKGKSCCSYNLSTTEPGDCILGKGDETIPEPISVYSGSSIMTDATFEEVPDEVVADSAIRVAMGSLVLAATTAMLSF